MEIQVTPDVVTTAETSYVIKMENATDKTIDLVCICKDLKEAKTVAISFATTLEKEMTTTTTQIYRRDLDNQIIISGRDLGKLYNSKLYKILTIQWCQVSHARLGVIEKTDVSTTPPLPSQPSQPIPIISQDTQNKSKIKQRVTLQERIENTGR